MPPCFRKILLALICLSVARLDAMECPWMVLIPTRDSRDAEMRSFDEADVWVQVGVLNDSRKIKDARFVVAGVPIANLLDALTPFAEFRYDSVHPADLTPGDKAVLDEWLKRGGFLMVFEDYYPYRHEEIRSEHHLPIYDFFTKELPLKDPNYTVGRADLRGPFFSNPFAAKPPPPILDELRENPGSHLFTTVSYKGRVVVFFQGRYNSMLNGQWVQQKKPFGIPSGLYFECYTLSLNIYYYAMTH